MAPRHSRDRTTTQRVRRGTKLSRARHSAPGCCAVHGMHHHHVSDAHLRFICWRYFIVIVFCIFYCKWSVSKLRRLFFLKTLFIFFIGNLEWAFQSFRVGLHKKWRTKKLSFYFLKFHFLKYFAGHTGTKLKKKNS